eukprot:1688215-Pyramimonas_sp.AAC.1
MTCNRTGIRHFPATYTATAAFESDRPAACCMYATPSKYTPLVLAEGDQLQLLLGPGGGSCMRACP